MRAGLKTRPTDVEGTSNGGRLNAIAALAPTSVVRALRPANADPIRIVAIGRKAVEAMSRRRISFGFALFLVWLGVSAASAQELWSNPATWGGQVPGPGAHVVIRQARRIILDVSPPPLGSITVIGALAFAEQDIDLTVGWIMVHGLLEIGTEQVPFQHHVNITLNGPLDEDRMGMGARFIGAMGGGTLEIHGARRADVDWAVLDGHANPGDTTINLALIEPNKTSLGWRPGDLLVIAPSGRDPLQAEGVTVTSVSGTQVSFTPPLQYPHWARCRQSPGERLMSTPRSNC